MHGLHRYSAFSDLLTGGDRYPILRIPAAD
jgi:hypothetical protein